MNMNSDGSEKYHSISKNYLNNALGILFYIELFEGIAKRNITCLLKYIIRIKLNFDVVIIIDRKNIIKLIN